MVSYASVNLSQPWKMVSVDLPSKKYNKKTGFSVLLCWFSMMNVAFPKPICVVSRLQSTTSQTLPQINGSQRQRTRVPSQSGLYQQERQVMEVSSSSWGYHNGWMVFVRGNPNLQWMMTGGTPMTKRKPPDS